MRRGTTFRAGKSGDEIAGTAQPYLGSRLVV
jgi:hypothetical protein